MHVGKKEEITWIEKHTHVNKFKLRNCKTINGKFVLGPEIKEEKFIIHLINVVRNCPRSLKVAQVKKKDFLLSLSFTLFIKLRH